MIRVNLLNDISGGGASVSSGPGGTTSVENPLLTDISGPDVDNFDLAVKIALFIVPLVLLYGYRQFLTSRAEAEHGRLQTQEKEVQAKLKGFDAALKDIERFEEEKRKLDSQLNVIKSLSKERLKNVKSLDAMQTIIPNSAWLESLKIKGDKVELEGYAVNDVVVSEFMQQLGSSIFFSHIVLTDSMEARTTEGSVKKFKIKCNLENI